MTAAKLRVFLVLSALTPFVIGTVLQAAEPGDLTLTVYNGDIALVRDVRRIDLPVYRSVLTLEDVSASIIPETVSLLADDVTVLEQNFDYDLLSPQKLLENAVGRRVRIVRTNPGNGAQTTEVAEVLSVSDGAVLRIGDRIEVLRDDGVPTRVIFDEVPPSLRARPTLSVDVQTDRAGPRRAELRYLTKGLQWKADYVAVFDEARQKLDLQGWVTLRNQSGTTYVDASTRLVAGELSLVDGTGLGARTGTGPQTAGTARSAQPTLGDLYLYELPGRTTIADQQTKQVAFASAPSVPASKIYRYVVTQPETMDSPESASIAIELANVGADGLGLPLPAGIVRVYARDSRSESQLIGENRIGHIPAGSQLAIDIGEAFDVTVQSAIVAQSEASILSGKITTKLRVTLRNARSEAVQVRFDQRLRRGWTIDEESLEGRSLDAFTHRWIVDVPAAGETVLRYAIERK